MHLIKRLRESLRLKGVLATLKSSVMKVADYRFDREYGTDTMRRVDAEALETDSENKPHAQCYQASKTRPLLKLLLELRLPRDGIFVDLGCGKGRVLLIAARLGFKKVVGIEFCAALCRRARENAELFFKKHPLSSPIEIIETDVTRYEFRDDENILFLYNPFDSVVLAEVLTAVRLSAQKKPRDLWLIYNNPVHDDVVRNNPLFAGFDRHEIEGEIFHVYHHRA